MMQEATPSQITSQPSGAAHSTVTCLAVGDAVLFAGDVGAARGESEWPAPSDAEPTTYLMLVHLLGGPAQPRRPSHEVRLMISDAPLTALGALDDGAARPHIVGMAVPRSQVYTGELAARSRLEHTPLVHASRTFLLSLFSSLRGRTAAEATAPTTEEVLTAMMRGIVREAPGVISLEPLNGDVREAITQLIETHHRDPHFTVESLARALNFSRRHLYRRAGALSSGISDLLAARRVTTARQLLESDPTLPLRDVAALSGFSRTAALRAQFLRRLGTTPTAYRQSLLDSDAGPRPDADTDAD